MGEGELAKKGKKSIPFLPLLALPPPPPPKEKNPDRRLALLRVPVRVQFLDLSELKRKPAEFVLSP